MAEVSVPASRRIPITTVERMIYSARTYWMVVMVCDLLGAAALSLRGTTCA